MISFSVKTDAIPFCVPPSIWLQKVLLYSVTFYSFNILYRYCKHISCISQNWFRSRYFPPYPPYGLHSHPFSCFLVRLWVCVRVWFYNDMHSVHFNNPSSHSIRKQLNKRQVEEKQKQTTAKRQKHNIQNIKAKTLSSNWSSLIDRVKAMAYWVTITPLTKRKLRFSVSSLISYRMF